MHMYMLESTTRRNLIMIFTYFIYQPHRVLGLNIINVVG